MSSVSALGSKLRAAARSTGARLWRGRSAVRLLLAGGALIVVLAVLAFGLMRLLGPRERFTTFILPYVEDFKDVDLKKWYSQDGVWTLRNEALVQTSNPPASANQAAKPAHAFIPQKLDADTPYHLSVYLALAKTTREVGVNFNAQYPRLTEQLHRVTLERKDDDATLLAAGYTDTDGKFVPQVELPLASSAQNYRLDVFVYEKIYVVQVDGQTVVDKRPLFYPNGLVGFYAVGPATFDTVKISAAESEPPKEEFYVSDFDKQPAAAGWVPLSGKWRATGGELVQSDDVAQDAAMVYEGRTFDDFVLQVTFRHVKGTGAGLLFGMPSPYQLDGGHIVRYSEQSDSLFWGYFDDKGAFTRQGFLEAPPPGQEPHLLRIFSDNSNAAYDIFLDERLVARGVPLHATTAVSSTVTAAGHIGLITSRSGAAYSLVEAFPLFGQAPPGATASPAAKPSPTPAPAKATAASARPAPTGTRPAQSTAAPAGVALRSDSSAIVTGAAAPLRSDFTGSLASSGWKPVGGSWRFENGRLVQGDAAGFDLSIVYTGNAFRNYTLEVSLAHLAGNGGGILFNMPYTDRLNGAHMVRYSDRRPGGLFWGYYDAGGKFIGQGYANAEPPGDATHSFRIVCGANSYSIYLDGIALGENIPYTNAEAVAEGAFGYIGLITAQSSVAYESVQVSAAEAAGGAARPAVRATARPVGGTTAVPRAGRPTVVAGAGGGFADQRVVNGQWTTGNGVYRQTVPDVADYLLSTGIAASNYTIEADIILPDKPEVGAGFLLNMPDRGRRNGASMVRLAKGGGSVMWGVYDEAASFRGRGSKELALNESGRYKLRLVIGGSRLDAFVNDEQVATNVTLPQAEGWIALLAFGGPVTFENVQVTTGLSQ